MNTKCKYIYIMVLYKLQLDQCTIFIQKQISLFFPFSCYASKNYTSNYSGVTDQRVLVVTSHAHAHVYRCLLHIWWRSLMSWAWLRSCEGSLYLNSRFKFTGRTGERRTWRTRLQIAILTWIIQALNVLHSFKDFLVCVDKNAHVYWPQQHSTRAALPGKSFHCVLYPHAPIVHKCR